MKTSKTILNTLMLLVATLFFQSCGGDDTVPINEINLVTSEGNSLAMNGQWTSSCEAIGNNFGKEVFTFIGSDVNINIKFFASAGCQGAPTQEQTILLDIKDVGGTYAVTLDGNTVMANKVSGMESRLGETGSDSFKQAFYIDDSGTQTILYHGIFGDDGGAVSADGYPLELHNISFKKQ